MKKKKKSFAITQPFSFHFSDDGNAIEVRCNMFGFIKVFVNGKPVASKWTLSSSRFALFNIGPALYSANFKTLSGDNELSLCTLTKDDVEIQRQKLKLTEVTRPTDGLVFPALTVVLVFVAALFATGCIYWDVAREFYYVLYAATFLMVSMEVIDTVKRNALLVVDADSDAGPTIAATDSQNLYCGACSSVNPPDTAYCDHCGCPLNASAALVKGWIESGTTLPRKPSTLNHLRSKSQALFGRITPAQLVSGCPQCRLFMYAYDRSCPHCGYRLKLAERQELCERYNYDSAVVTNLLFAFFVVFLFLVFVAIYTVTNFAWTDMSVTLVPTVYSNTSGFESWPLSWLAVATDPVASAAA